MKNKRLLTFVLLIIIMSSLSLGLIFEQNKKVDINIPCFNNNTYCSSAAQCNITIFYPNSSVLVDNAIMTNNLSFHNYTLNQNFTSLNGDYTSSVICNDESFNGDDVFLFTITTSGTQPTTMQGIVYLVLIVISILITLILMVLAWNINGENEFNMGGVISINYNKFIKMGLWLLSYIFMILTLFLGWQISIFVSNDSLIGIMKLFFILSVIAFLPIFLLVFWFTLIKMMADMKLWELAKRNLKPR